jgi:hypothetical protein
MFTARKQEQNKNIYQFANALSKLARTAFQGADGWRASQLLVEQFVDGLRDHGVACETNDDCRSSANCG